MASCETPFHEAGAEVRRQRLIHVNDDAGDVVARATLLGCLDDFMRGQLWVWGGEQEVADHRCRSPVSDAIGAEHVPVARCGDDLLRLGAAAAFFGPEVLIEHVFVAVRQGLFQGDRASVD